MTRRTAQQAGEVSYASLAEPAIEVFNYWTQNKELAVDLKVLQPETGAVPSLIEGSILQIRVSNQRHRVTVAFNELEDAQAGDLILLLDEPGLSLHARAQEDLLRLIDEQPPATRCYIPVTRRYSLRRSLQPGPHRD
jgi:hypothetical protein